MKKHFKKLLIVLSFVFLPLSNANAHAVSLSWDVLTGGDVRFYLQHWHGNHPAGGSLFVDGVEHVFTDVHHNIWSISGLEGALVNPTFASFAGDTLTVLLDPNFLSVVVSGLQPGAHTFGTTNIALTSWTMPSNGGQINVVLPPAPQVPEPSVLVLLMVGIGLLVVNRLKKINQHTQLLFN